MVRLARHLKVATHEYAIPDTPRHSQTILSGSEVVTIGILYAVKGLTAKDPAARFLSWLRDNYGRLFPKLPERSRLFRRLHTQRYWTGRFLATPTLMGIADSYGVELRHPVRDGRCAGQIGHKGISNRRWIAGGKLCAVVNRFGLICDWDCAGANVHDQTFHPLLRRYDGRMVVLADRGFHRVAGDLANVMICRRGQWNVGMKVETVFSVMSVKWGFKEQRHRGGQVLRRIWRMRWRGSTYWRNGMDWNRTRRGAFNCLSPNSPWLPEMSCPPNDNRPRIFRRSGSIA